jgi:ribosome biogenesis GTPase / thiamine phosphate phosphatase
VEGIVIRSTGNLHYVMTGNGNLVECTLKGLFRIKGLKATNPIAVGDRVEFEDPGPEKTGSIRKIFERKNYIIRKSTKLSKTVHIIAANIDQALLVVTLALPRTSTGFVDRFIVTAEAYKIPVILVFNKIDIYDSRLQKMQDEWFKIYEPIGYHCMGISALKKKNITAVKNVMKDKVSLIAGHSGVGKSALINTIEPGLKLKTADISEFSRKGKHTTTFTEMHPLSFGGYIIDTPGIKEFGLVDFYREELTHYFPEMFALLDKCQFHNCTHTHEPKCAVRDAVEEGKISPVRYENYLNIYFGREISENEWD